MTLETALSTILKNKRISSGYTQEELAFRCGIDRTYISLIEREKRNPTIHVLYSICVSLDISLSSFIQEVENLITHTDH